MADIQIKKISKKQLEVLSKLKDGAEIVFEKGAGWWIEEDRTNGKLVREFLKMCVLRECDYGGILIRYTINETGLNALKTGWFSLPEELYNQIKNCPLIK